MESKRSKVYPIHRSVADLELPERQIPAGMAVERRPFPTRVRDAARGIWDAYREEPNLRFHAVAATMAAGLAWAVGLEGWGLSYLLGTVFLVLVTEAINTAVERAVDLASQGRVHPLARQAKDAAAGAVLLAVLHATMAGYLLFVRPWGVSGLLVAVATAMDRAPAIALAMGGLVALATVGGLVAGRRRL